MAPNPAVGTDIDSLNPLKQHAWNQFADNERLFDITADYGNNIYTAAINKNDPQYKASLAKAMEIESLVRRAPTMASQKTLVPGPIPPKISPPPSSMSYAQAARGLAGAAFHSGFKSVNESSERAPDNRTQDSQVAQSGSHVVEGSSRDAPNTEQAHTLTDDIAAVTKAVVKDNQRDTTDFSKRKKDLEAKLKILRSFHEAFVLLTPTPPDIGPDEIGELAMKAEGKLVRQFQQPNENKVKVREERMAGPIVGKSIPPVVLSPPVVSSFPMEEEVEVREERKYAPIIVKLPKTSSPPVASPLPIEKEVEVRERRMYAPIIVRLPKTSSPAVLSMPFVQEVSLHTLQDATHDLNDAFGSQLRTISELTTPAELGGNQGSLKGYRAHQLKEYNLNLQPGAESILDSGSSAETLTNNLKSRTSAAPLSTVPTSLFDTSSSKGPKNIVIQGLSAEGTNLLATAEVSDPVVRQQTDWEDQSSISSVTILDPKQKKDIIKKFVEAVLKNLQYERLPSHDYKKSRNPFKQCLQVLLKNYSEQIKNDTDQRTRRQAAKQIRLLRREISERFEEAFGGLELSSKDQRVYPNIVKQAEKIYPPEKTWAEKVGDWNDVLSKEVPQPETLFENEQYGLQVENQIVAVSVGGAGPASYPASLSDFDQTGSSSESEMNEVVHLTPKEDKDIYDFLTTHHAFQELVKDIRRLIECHISNQMEVVRNRVLLSLRRPIDRGIQKSGRQSRHTAIVYFDWDLLSFLQEQYPLGLSQSLDSILTISGQATDAYMSTVRNYLEITWPENPTALLDTLQGAIFNDPRNETSGSILFSNAKSDIMVNLLEKSLLITGSEEFVVTVAQQISWLTAACRVAPLGLGCSSISFNEVASKFGLPLCTFKISSEVLPLTSDDPGSCWNEVVGSSTIVTGFPIPERLNNEKGLELPLEVMAALGGVPLATQFNGSYVLKARSIAFVPVQRSGRSIQWHLVKKGGAKLRYEDIDDLCPIRLPVEVLNQDELFSTRAFLGWCSDTTNNLGTTFARYHTIDFSNANTPSKKVVALTGVSVGFAHIGTGQANFTFGKHSGSYTADKPNYYSDVLDDAKQIHVILQDAEHRRAWQADGERVILDLILHRHTKGAYKIEGKAVELVPADLKRPPSVRSAMLQNANFVVTQDYHMDKREVNTKLFKDLVGDLYARLEGLEANVERVKLAGIELKLDWRRRIQGYEYMDLVNKKHKMLIKEAELKKTCGQWPEFAREIGAVVLFGKDFGDVLLPEQSFKLCPTFRTVPKGKDYLVIETPTLQRLYSEHGSQQTQQQLTAAGTQWHRSTHLFEACPRLKGPKTGPCKCDRIQEFISKNAFGRVKAPGRLGNSGAVIFGQGSSRWPRDIANSWLNVKDSLKREEPQLPRQSQAPGPTFIQIQNDPNSRSRNSGLAQEAAISLVSVKEGTSTITLANIESLGPNSSDSRPIQQSPRNRSFQYSEKTGSSTGKSSNGIDADLEFITPATSVPTGSEDGHETYFSSNGKPSIRENFQKMASGKNEYGPARVFNPPLGPSDGRKNEQIRYSNAVRANLLPYAALAVPMKMASKPSSLRKEHELADKAAPRVFVPSFEHCESSKQPLQNRYPRNRSVSALTDSSTTRPSFGEPRSHVLRRKPAFQQDIIASSFPVPMMASSTQVVTTCPKLRQI